MDIEVIKETYKEMYDAQLEEQAKEIFTLVRPAQFALLDEMKSRDLDSAKIKKLEKDIEDFSEQNIVRLEVQFRNLTCPVCGKSEDKINLKTFQKVKSYLPFTHVNKLSIIACRKCLLKVYKDYRKSTLIFGWWGFPGFFRNIIALIQNNKAVNTLDVLDEYTKEWILRNKDTILNGDLGQLNFEKSLKSEKYTLK